jgi:hypothetical protein
MRVMLHLLAIGVAALPWGVPASAAPRHQGFVAPHETIAPVSHGFKHGFGPRPFGGTFARSGLDRRFDLPGDCSVFHRRPCNASPCSVFSHEPCLPGAPYPYGETLQLTITTAAEDAKPATAGNPAPDGERSATEISPSAADTSHKIDTISEMFDALRGCWIPPPADEARSGMEMTVRLSFKRTGEIFGPPRVTYVNRDAPQDARDHYHDAITAALDRCTPMPFTAGLAGAIAGRPIAIRFVDNRKEN